KEAISRILFPRSGWLSFICPEGYPTGSICLPWIVSPKRIGRAALQRSYTWHFSMQGLPPAGVTTDSRELLPHVFTIASQRLVVIFCGTLCSPLARRPGCSPVHCSVLSGLSYPS